VATTLPSLTFWNSGLGSLSELVTLCSRSLRTGNYSSRNKDGRMANFDCKMVVTARQCHNHFAVKVFKNGVYMLSDEYFSRVYHDKVLG